MNDPNFNTGPASNMGASAPDINVATAVVTPTDRVRWSAIFAGLVAALSALVVLSVLGIAIGLSAYDPGDDARGFGIGAGVWGIISMILAFFFGGWLAARSAAVRGERNGLLNGSLVWAVAIPLMAFLLAGGVLGAGNAAANMTDEETRQRAQDQVDRVVKASTGNPDQTQQTQQDRQQAARTGSKAAWGTLVSMLLGLVAAAVGGYTGARDRNIFDRNDRRFSGEQNRGQEQQGGSRSYGSNP